MSEQSDLLFSNRNLANQKPERSPEIVYGDSAFGVYSSTPILFIAGIMVKEHFEINVCPIAVRLTYKLVVNLENFFFDKTPAVDEAQEQISFQHGIQGKCYLVLLVNNGLV